MPKKVHAVNGKTYLLLLSTKKCGWTLGEITLQIKYIYIYINIQITQFRFKNEAGTREVRFCVQILFQLCKDTKTYPLALTTTRDNTKKILQNISSDDRDIAKLY